MKKSLLFAYLLLILNFVEAQPQYRPDILGEGFEQCTLDLGTDAPATLVRRVPRVESSRAILYLHGYNDYFFQREMADRVADSLYNFYAIDLHNYGRSLREGQTPFEFYSIDEYFPDLDAAIGVMRDEGAEHITLLAHSTGGLIASLYCESVRDQPTVDALILNSPFLDMNLGWFLEEVGVPVISMLGGYMPDVVVFHDLSRSYFESLDSGHHGEWSYDTNLKFKNSPPTTAGWVRAINEGHKQLQQGLQIDIPILLLYSDKSFLDFDWDPRHQISDGVLDVKEIAKYGRTLGSHVSEVEIEDGMHDLILSKFEAREAAYSAMFLFLNQLQD